MRKVLLYLLIIILLCFLLPVIFTKRFNIVETISEIKENIEKKRRGKNFRL